MASLFRFSAEPIQQMALLANSVLMEHFETLEMKNVIDIHWDVATSFS